MTKTHNKEKNISKFEPNFSGECDNCGQSPTVTLIENGRKTTEYGMCGPCVFGTAQALDSDYWNKGDKQ